MAVNLARTAADKHKAGRMGRQIRAGCRLMACVLVALLIAGCAAPWQTSRTKTSTAGSTAAAKTKGQRSLAAGSGSKTDDSPIQDVKQFVAAPRVGLPFDDKE